MRIFDKAALDSQFSGDALESLKQMGVEVYAEGELERGIIQQAQQQLADKDKAQTKQRPAAAEQLAANGEAGGKRAAEPHPVAAGDRSCARWRRRRLRQRRGARALTDAVGVEREGGGGGVDARREEAMMRVRVRVYGTWVVANITS